MNSFFNNFNPLNKISFKIQNKGEANKDGVTKFVTHSDYYYHTSNTYKSLFLHLFILVLLCFVLNFGAFATILVKESTISIPKYTIFKNKVKVENHLKLIQPKRSDLELIDSFYGYYFTNIWEHTTAHSIREKGNNYVRINLQQLKKDLDISYNLNIISYNIHFSNLRITPYIFWDSISTDLLLVDTNRHVIYAKDQENATVLHAINFKSYTTSTLSNNPNITYYSTCTFGDDIYVFQADIFDNPYVYLISEQKWKSVTFTLPNDAPSSFFSSKFIGCSTKDRTATFIESGNLTYSNLKQLFIKFDSVDKNGVVYISPTNIESFSNPISMFLDNHIISISKSISNTYSVNYIRWIQDQLKFDLLKQVSIQKINNEINSHNLDIKSSLQIGNSLYLLADNTDYFFLEILFNFDNTYSTPMLDVETIIKTNTIDDNSYQLTYFFNTDFNSVISFNSTHIALFPVINR